MFFHRQNAKTKRIKTKTKQKTQKRNEVKIMKKYNVSETAKILNVSTRTIQTYCKLKGLRKTKGRYQISEVQISDWKYSLQSETKRKNETKQNENETKNAKTKRNENEANSIEKAIQIVEKFAQEKKLQLRIFSDEEFDELQKIKHEYPRLLQEIEYLKNRIEKMDQTFLSLTESLQESIQNTQRFQTLHAKDKGIL